MAQLERQIYDYMLSSPAIRKAYSQGLVNRRALARKIIKENQELKNSQFEAIIAILRRMKFEKEDSSPPSISDARLVIKDDIAIINLQKSKQTLTSLQQIMPKISYEKHETFKIVVGTSSIKVFLDKKNLNLIEDITSKKEIIYTHKKISELSLQFEQKSAQEKGVIAYIASSLALNNIAIEEFLSCSPELLIYVNEEHSLKAYETIKKMQK